MWILFSIIALFSVGGNITIRARGVSWAAFVLKTLCGVEFVFLAVAGCFYLNHKHGELGAYFEMAVLFVAGAVAGLAGDVVLSLKDLIPRARIPLFISGFIAFGVGHVLYVIGIAIAWRITVFWLAIALSASVILAVIFVKIAKHLGLRFGRFTMIVRGYGALLLSLSAVGIAALSGHNPLWEAGIAGQPIAVAIGGLSFLISDIVLGYTYFGKDRESPLGHAMCYVFYYTAQFLLAGSLFLL